MPHLYPLVWYVANLLAAYVPLVVAFTNSGKKFGQTTARQNPAPNNWLANIGRAAEGMIQTYP